MLVELSLVYLTADGQSTSSSWFRAPLWAHHQIFILIFFLLIIALLFFLYGALSDEKTVL
jgi:hypothetical protein